jgi:F0F1-type ATP synthase assembly protein I
MKLPLNKKTENDSGSKFNSVGPLLGVGSQLAVTMVAFVLIGKYIDDKNNTHPTWTMIFSFLGIIIGLYSFLKTIFSMHKKTPKK